MPSPKKAIEKKVPFASRLLKPDASFSLSSFGSLAFGAVVDISLKNGKIGSFGLETTGPEPFQRILSEGCSLFVGLSQSDAELVTLSHFQEKLSALPGEKLFFVYAHTLIQDAISRLFFDDPLSDARRKISNFRDEFSLGGLSSDYED